MTLQEFLKNNESSFGQKGAKWNDCANLKQINKARSLIYSLGVWDGMISYLCVKCLSGVFYLPFSAERILSAYRCSSGIKIAEGEYFSVVRGSNVGDPISIIDNKVYSSTPVDIDYTGFINFRLTDFNDKGSNVNIVYRNTSGSIVTDNILIEKPFEKYRTSTKVKEILSLTKDSTSGNLEVLTGMGKYLFHLSPYETEAKYRRYCASTHCCSKSKCSCSSEIIIQTKNKFYPYTELHYSHIIDVNEHALVLALQAIAALEKRDTEGFNLYKSIIASVVDFLKKEQLEKATLSSNTETTSMNSIAPPIIGFNMCY